MTVRPHGEGGGLGTKTVSVGGVHSCVGPTPPADPAQFQFVALDTATPYLLEYEASDAGKLASYVMRWENTRGEFGPWSETVSATIPA